MKIAAIPRFETPPPDDRPIVLCVHASASSGRQWDALAARLRGRADVVAPDLHDHGDGPSAPQGEEDLLALDAGLIERVLRDLPGAVHLVGHSYGGAVALCAARRCPGRIRSLVVFEPAWFGLLRTTAPVPTRTGASRGSQSQCISTCGADARTRRHACSSTSGAGPAPTRQCRRASAMRSSGEWGPWCGSSTVSSRIRAGVPAAACRPPGRCCI